MSRASIAWREVPAGGDRREVSRALLAQLAGGSLTLRQRCDRCGAADHGALRTAPGEPPVSVAYAVSRAGAPVFAVAAIGRGEAAIGVDAEYAVDAVRDATGLAPVLGRARAGIRDWVRVEAALKADGRGLLVPPADVRVSSIGGRWRARVPGVARSLRGRDIPGPPGILISLALSPLALRASQHSSPESTPHRRTSGVDSRDEC